MGQATFDGPIRVGNVRDTTGTTVGLNVRNTGTVVAIQETQITQAASGPISIVIPARSLIHSIQLLVTTAWTGAAATLGVGVVGDNTFFTAAGAVSAASIGPVNAVAGTDATRTGNFIDTGAVDRQLTVTSTNTGAGVAILVVVYAQGIQSNEPTI